MDKVINLDLGDVNVTHHRDFSITLTLYGEFKKGRKFEPVVKVQLRPAMARWIAEGLTDEVRVLRDSLNSELSAIREAANK